MEEFEIKFLEVDVPALEKKLFEIGAQKIGELKYQRALLDYADFSLGQKQGWIKLRTDGSQTTLAYKQRLGVKSHDGSIPDDGMKEIEVSVDDYEKTKELLKAIGLVIKREEENNRTRYQKNNTIFDIDFWPFIPPYLEIESDSIEEVKKSAQEIGFDPIVGLVCSAQQVYQKYGFNLNDYSSITLKGMIKK